MRRNASRSTPRRISPGLSPAPPVRRFGGLAVPVAQSSRWALAAPSARFAPSGASEPPKGVVPPQKWWPSVVAGTSRSSSVTAPPASKCGCGVCPAPQARAKRAPRATRATPAQAFRAPLRRKKRGLPLQQARRAIAPFARSPVRRGRRSRASRSSAGHVTPHPARASARFRKFVHPQPPPDRELDHRRDGRGIQHAHQRPAEMPPVEGHAA